MVAIPDAVPCSQEVRDVGRSELERTVAWWSGDGIHPIIPIAATSVPRFRVQFRRSCEDGVPKRTTRVPDLSPTGAWGMAFNSPLYASGTVALPPVLGVRQFA